MQNAELAEGLRLPILHSSFCIHLDLLRPRRLGLRDVQLEQAVLQLGADVRQHATGRADRSFLSAVHRLTLSGERKISDLQGRFSRTVWLQRRMVEAKLQREVATSVRDGILGVKT